MMKSSKIIFSGASITNSPWYTWKDFVQMRYKLNGSINNAYNGVGNEFIVESTMHRCNMNPGSTALVMLTNFDKWDWFIDDPILAQSINENEKHPVRDVSGRISLSGYWSTGSWFPEGKKYFLQHYYNHLYFLKQTLKNLYVLQNFFSTNHIKNHILFDSPILHVAEQDLILGGIQKLPISENTMIQSWIQMIDWSNIYQPGLIGFCHDNNLPWYNKKVKAHPPSSSHLFFADKYIFPYLDEFFPVQEENLSWMIPKMDQLWNV